MVLIAFSRGHFGDYLAQVLSHLVKNFVVKSLNTIDPLEVFLAKN